MPVTRRRTRAQNKKLPSPAPEEPPKDETATPTETTETAQAVVEEAHDEPKTSDNVEEQVTPQPAAPVEDQETTQNAIDPAARAAERLARFKALKARAKLSSETNLKEATREAQRVSVDASQLTAVHRQHAIASHKLLKADTEEAGEDFERKRAWDWTIDESERWDKRMKKKQVGRDDTAFQDYRHLSNKVYKRQIKNLKPDMEKYVKSKLEAIEKAAAAGSLDILETEDGELVAVDKDGSFYSAADSASFAQNRPDKAAIDRLVQDLQAKDEANLKARAKRMAKNGEDGDVTYINEKNKQFNMKLERFYNKYTAEIRDSFERGTMI